MNIINLHSSDETEQQGFTIIELMIASLVFSMILLVITYGVINFTNQYYKGVNSSTTQGAAQNAIDAISQAVQFSADDTVATDGSQGFFCAGTKLYVYSLGKQFAGTPTAADRGLYEMNRSGASCGPAPAVLSGGTELLGEGMRLAAINVSPVTAPATSGPVWQVSIRVIYGDSDLLCDTSVVGTGLGGCANGSTNYAAGSLVSDDKKTCRSQIGSQFCSVSAISTIAQQRIVN